MNAEAYEGRKLGNFKIIEKIFHAAGSLRAEMEEFFGTVELLHKDASDSERECAQDVTNGKRRRDFIKSLFAWLEGQCFMMKRMCLERHYNWKDCFSDAEIAMLKEEKHTLDEKGGVNTSSKNYQRFLSNYQFAFRSFAKAHAVDFEFDKNGLPDLKRLESVRNRLTHPKALADLDVLDEEVALAVKVLNWHSEETCKLLGKSKELKPQDIDAALLSEVGEVRVVMPFVFLGKDGAIIEFPTQSAAAEFAAANGCREPGIEFTIVPAKEILRA